MKDILEELGLPVAYDHFINPPSIPFILYRETETETFKADNKVYFIQPEYIIDLVVEYKSPELEAQLEEILNNHNLPFDKAEDYIEAERIYQIRYYI